LLWEYNEENIPRIKKSRQFGTGPWRWTGLESKGDYIADRAGNEYQIQVVELDRKYPGWNVVHLRRLDAITKAVIEPLIKTTGPIVLALCVLIGIAVFFLYRQASHEIRQRRLAESALRESEGRHRSLYHHTPAMLHSIDPGGRLVSVSDYWVEVMECRIPPICRNHHFPSIFPERILPGYSLSVCQKEWRKNRRPAFGHCRPGCGR
jgi:PAS domain-containing protein